MRALFLAVLLAAAAPAAFADDDDRGKRWKEHRYEHRHHDDRYGHHRRHDDDRRDWRRDERYDHRYDHRDGRTYEHRDVYRYEGYGGYGRHDRTVDILLGGYFGDHHRGVVSRYYGYDCERGRHRGRGWALGHSLGRDVYYAPLPYDLYRRLPPPPYGHTYVQVDRDVLLVAEASRRVIDALVLVSALD